MKKKNIRRVEMWLDSWAAQQHMGHGTDPDALRAAFRAEFGKPRPEYQHFGPAIYDATAGVWVTPSGEKYTGFIRA